MAASIVESTNFPQGSRGNLPIILKHDPPRRARDTINIARVCAVLIAIRVAGNVPYARLDDGDEARAPASRSGVKWERPRYRRDSNQIFTDNVIKRRRYTARNPVQIGARVLLRDGRLSIGSTNALYNST